MTYHTFEFSLYNSEVREHIALGEIHKQLDDSWAEQRYIQIRAVDEENAYKAIYRRFPKRAGFVITSVIEIED